MVTQTPEPPPYGTPAGETPPQNAPVPQMPQSVQYAAATGQKAGRTADVALSWILYAVHICATLVVGLISLFAIFLTDSCGSSTVDASVCDFDYFGGVLLGFWITLVALAVAVPVMIIVATVRKTPVWPWSVGGFGLLVLASIIFFVLVSS